MNVSLKSVIKAVAGVATAAVIATGAMAASINGAGASFPYPIYAKWAGAYQGVSGVGLNYQSIGSGGGIAQIKAKTVTFGATDAPLKAAELQKFGLAQFPTVIGGVVPVVNVPGVAAGQLVLNGEVIADIFMGKISRWDDPRIKALNPGVNLPGKAISVVHRADASGTSFVFTTYLSRVSKDWAGSVGAATAVDWPVGIGAKGNEGVAGNVAQRGGSIGYVEYAYAMQNKLAWMRMKNHDGKVVSPSMETFQASAARADWAHADHFFMILTDQPGANSWPIENPTFVLFYKDPSDPAASKEALDFFKWAYADGDEMAKSLLYIPLPDSVVKMIETSWKQIKGSGM